MTYRLCSHSSPKLSVLGISYHSLTLENFRHNLLLTVLSVMLHWRALLSINQNHHATQTPLVFYPLEVAKAHVLIYFLVFTLLIQCEVCSLQMLSITSARAANYFSRSRNITGHCCGPDTVGDGGGGVGSS